MVNFIVRDARSVERIFPVAEVSRRSFVVGTHLPGGGSLATNLGKTSDLRCVHRR